MGLVLLAIVFLMLIGALPTWGYHQWGYYPSGGLGMILTILVVMLLLGYIPRRF